MAQADNSGRLRREYFGKEEAGAPRTDRTGRPARGDFSFDGHRLSSLYRGADQTTQVLRKSYAPSSSLEKYSAGVRGREAPALASQGDNR